MAIAKRKEWSKYAVGEPSTKKNWTNPDCVPFNTVHHICHVSDAFRAFEDGKLRSTLVWDESKLRNTRTCVSWLSPNLWSAGSLYGNVRFDFAWQKLVEGKNFYWVEAMSRYHPPACRILITTKVPSLELEPYAVEAGDGPLYYDSTSGIWYCNGKLTGEFMLDCDLSLIDCQAVGFEKHHERFCRKDGSRCGDLGQRADDAGAKLIARLVAQKVVHNNPHLQKLFLSKETLNSECRYSWIRILNSFSRIETGGNITHKHPAASPIAIAMLDRFAAERSFKQLGALFSTPEELELTLRHGAVSAFGISASKVPKSEDE